MDARNKSGHDDMGAGMTKPDLAWTLFSNGSLSIRRR